MLGSSKTGREYNQEQIILNSVSSIGIPLSLTSSSTTSLLHPATSLSINTSNSLVQTTSPATSSTTSSNIVLSTINNDNVKSQNDKNTDNDTVSDETLTNSTSKTGKEKGLNLEAGKTDLNITSDVKNNYSTITDDIAFKYTDESNNISLDTTNIDNSVDEKDKLDGLQTSLFLTSGLPLNLDDIADPDTNSFLSGAIDMDIDLLNSSITNGLNGINMDISTTTSAVTATSEVPSTSVTTSSTAITKSTTKATPEATESTSSLMMTDSHNNTKVLSTDGNTKNNNNLLLKNNSLNTMNSISSTAEDKKDILEFLNTEDLENNLKLYQFPSQSLLLSQQKDLSGNTVATLSNNLPILNDQSLADQAVAAAIPVVHTSDSSTTSMSKNSTIATATTAAPAVVPSTNAAVALNININTTTTDVNTKVAAAAVSTNPNDILTVGPNPMLGIPPMMNDPNFYNMNANPAVPKVNYYPQQNPMVKAPPNDVIMKKVYNGIVKQENINDLQKNPQNRDVLKNQLSSGKINLKELNEANPNVKVNMKSVKSGAPKGRRVQSRNASLRPTLSYVELITEAICDSEDGLLSLQEIYDAIKRKYVYFRTADPAWQNSIRHNLSVHQSFTKITRPPNRPGKGFLWTSSKIDYKNITPESRKRRKREHGDKAHTLNQTTQATKNPSYHANYPTSAAPMASSNVPQQNMNNNMNDINYILNQQQQQPRVSQKVLKILTDSSINTPSLKQLLFTGFKHMSNEPYHGQNGMNYPLNSYEDYSRASHTSSMYSNGSQYLANSSGYPSQMNNTSMSLSLNPLMMPTGSSSLPSSNGFPKGSSTSYQNSFTNTGSTLSLNSMDNINQQKYSSNSMYPISLLDPEYSFRYPSQTMYHSSYYYPSTKNDILMHNNTRRYSFDSAMTSSAAFAAAAAAASHNNSNPNAPSPPFFSLAKSQSAKNVPSGPNYIKKDREKKIMYEKMHLSNDFNNIVNQPPPQYAGNSSNFVGTGATASLNYAHKHIPTNYGNNLPLQPPTFNATNTVSKIPSSKPLTTPVIYETKTEHNAIDSSMLSSSSTVIENETPVIVANKEQA